ncbi:hypothetical protein [Rhizobium sp. R86522]|uniref:hypothetical protein n=1 Tax=Rhizobium sp. R86522 TaxID=3093861 RepID=UPI00366BCB14
MVAFPLRTAVFIPSRVACPALLDEFMAHRGTHVQFHIGDRAAGFDGPDGAVVVVQILQVLISTES